MSAPKPGLVSVIIPVYNRAGMLQKAVASVLAQTYPAVDIVIVDDGSIDDTAAVAAELASAHPASVHSVRQDNAGPGAARNLGLRHARGEFIQYLDSDDLLAPRKFELQVAALRANPDAGVAYGITERVNTATGECRVWARTGQPIRQIFPDFLMKRSWDTNSPLWRRSACDAIGPWLELRCMEDWEHDLRAGMLGIRPVQVHEHVATVRDHGGDRASGMSTGFNVAITRDFFRAHEAVWAQMRALGLTDWAYLREFGRKLFWIARMCGERGLVAEADRALAMAQEMVATHQPAIGLKCYAWAVRLLGWHRAVAWSEAARSALRPGSRDRAALPGGVVGNASRE